MFEPFLIVVFAQILQWVPKLLHATVYLCRRMFTHSANHSNHLYRYREHLDNTAKLVETGIQTMEESEMAIFLQVCQVYLLWSCVLFFIRNT